ncbi:30S ribosomal protein S8 [candidate division WWE3 bacterium RIFCSPHIGHO2_01_FULL_42_13]|uniref:Small ribosomal subunit protein uS8 n=1 Tax=candidate division WWE3 bacterium RIFCSPHIGHO2_01_FULL_42_13 TaxID=1802617 RepID=A0A1F4UQM2_UNCKA|nr:MAG: 30S ribosomal protein S8 [candidate division WWE3 bacterium RIFCSPHIGHO2_01_FULL_42_13]
MVMDTISNMLSSIKNASAVGKEFVELPYTKVNEAILEVLKKADFVAEAKVFKEKESSHKSLHIDLLYDDLGAPKIRKAGRISKPGRRIFKGYTELKRFVPGTGVWVVSTPRGILSSNEAKSKKLGGEIICEVM